MLLCFKSLLWKYFFSLLQVNIWAMFERCCEQVCWNFVWTLWSVLKTKPGVENLREQIKALYSYVMRRCVVVLLYTIIILHFAERHIYNTSLTFRFPLKKLKCYFPLWRYMLAFRRQCKRFNVTGPICPGNISVLWQNVISLRQGPCALNEKKVVSNVNNSNVISQSDLSVRCPHTAKRYIR